MLAHELGHLSGGHSRFAGWIYRVRATWIQVVMRFHEEPHYGAFIFERFLDWYAPFFNAYSFVLARAQEYQADALAVELAGREPAAKALINLEIKGKFLGDYCWPRFFGAANDQAEPPSDVFSRFVAATEEQIPASAAQKWYVEALAVRTGYEDTHPSLADRLAAIGYPISKVNDAELNEQVLSLIEKPEQTAAHHYLSKVADSFISGRNRWWQEMVLTAWRERRDQLHEAQKSLKQLEEKAQTQELTIEEQWQLICNLADVQGVEATLPKVAQLLKTYPDHVGANFLLGQVLLDKNDDDAGIAHIEKAMALDQNTTLPGCESIYLFFKRHGQEEDAERYRARAEQHYKISASAET